MLKITIAILISCHILFTDGGPGPDQDCLLIFVRNQQIGQEKYPIELSSNAKVSDIKKVIDGTPVVNNRPTNEYYISVGGTKLGDFAVLSDEGIGAESTVDIIELHEDLTELEGITPYVVGDEVCSYLVFSCIIFLHGTINFDECCWNQIHFMMNRKRLW